MPPSSYAGTVHAPDFPEGLDWLNTDRPLSLGDLRGKVVLLDFWTYCCINCMHVIPDLKRLEAKYPDELVVIGVHSAKFTTERESENIREAILRYEIEHPVVNDRDFLIWRSYAIRAWPSFMIIDPDGKVVGTHSGEGIYDLFDRVIGAILQEFDAQGKMDRRPLRLAPEKDVSSTPFSFPGKLAADPARLYVSDSNHHRIVALSLADSAVAEVIGDGVAGLRDGNLSEARFHRPQGVALDGDALYVADTENHAIRRVDLADRTVTTLAGTGRQGLYGHAGGRGPDVDLNSPWDLLVHGGKLYIAMAGPHQLWALDLRTLDTGPYAGSGMENILDADLPGAALAQPSGITTDGKRLYFADSETSAIRAADLDPRGRVETLVGAGLFEYGDRDGVGPEARLQHPLGVLYHDGLLYVADTYNNKIKRIGPATRRCETFLGTGRSGTADGPPERAEFNEPGGLTYANGKLYIADTNNHLIRVYDFGTQQVSTLRVK